MGKKILHNAGPILGVIVFAIMLALLHQALREYHYQQILREFRHLPAAKVLLALALTLLNYAALTGYDLLALRYIRRPLSLGRTAFTSFVAYAFAQGLGIPVLTGASVRYRLYSSWGLSGAEIASAVTFTTLTFWVGMLALGGTVFVMAPVPPPAFIHLPFSSLRLVGVLMLALVAAYALAGALYKQPLRIRSWELRPPGLGYLAGQVAVSAVDWALAGTVLYALLPADAGLSFINVLAIFLLAQIAGLISQVPAGLGVFETIVIYFLSPQVPGPQALGLLIAYRAVYYLFPLGLAGVALASLELSRKFTGLRRLPRLFGKWLPALAPQTLAVLTFIGGAILLFSGSTPELSRRLHFLQDFLPLPVMELSHFLGSLTGACLLILARGLQRRIDAAYFLTMIMLAAGIIFSLLKGADYEEALILDLMLIVLLPSRGYFYRRASLWSGELTPGWIAAVVIVIASSIWLGIFSNKHVEYAHDLWWRFSLTGDAPRFLRATVGVLGALLVFGVARLLQPAARAPALPNPDTLARALPIIQKSRETSAYLALMGDKELLFSDSGESFIMFGVAGRSWVAMGDPVGAASELDDLAWRFVEMARQHGAWPVFYEVGAANINIYIELGLALMKLGESARVHLPDFTIQGSKHHARNLRHSRNQVEKAGCRFEIVPPEAQGPILSELEAVSNAWLEERHTREKGFSLGFFDPDYLRHFPLGLVRRDGAILAFANILQGADREELSIDLMRHTPEAPGGIMDYLFVELLLWGKEQGYEWFNLGMAPLAGLEPRLHAPLWNRIADLIYHYGETYYNFQGIKNYKDKFEPEWHSRYLVSPGGLVLPTILANLATLTSQGLKGVIAK